MRRDWKKITPAALALAAALLLPAGTANAGCGDYNADGSVGASDALGVLQTAVGSRSCDKVRCDVDGNGSVTGSDALIVLKNAVGGTIAWSCPGVAIANIDELPRATAPVSGAGTSAFVLGALEAARAEHGINLAQLDAGTFDRDSSMAACEVANMTKSVLNEAAQGDLILCYVQNLIAGAGDQAFDVYDGEYHTFALDFPDPPPGAESENQGGPSAVRIRLVRGGDTITDFEMFACGDDAAGDAQTEYVRQTIDGPDFTMTAVGYHTGEGEGGGGRRVTVAGSLNDEGSFVGRKVVDLEYSNDWGDGSGYGEMGFLQGVADFSVDGYDKHTFTYGEHSGTFSRQTHARAELLDSNVPGDPYSMSLLAVGHGAANTRSVGKTGVDEWTFEAVGGWNGDTTHPDDEAAGDFLPAVAEAVLPAVSEGVDIVFEESETWDCGGPVEAVLSVDMIHLDAECSDLELGWDWVNCHEIIQPAPPDGGCEGPDCGPCEGPDCGPGSCWEPTCGCVPDDPGCVDQCWNPECGEPTCDSLSCWPSCEGPDCGYCEGPDCGPDPECWDPSCECNPEDPQCVEECWDPECGDPCGPEGCGPCEGPDCPQ